MRPTSTARSVGIPAGEVALTSQLATVTLPIPPRDSRITSTPPPAPSSDRPGASDRSWRIAPRRSAAGRSRRLLVSVLLLRSAGRRQPRQHSRRLHHDNLEAGGGRTDVVAPTTPSRRRSPSSPAPSPTDCRIASTSRSRYRWCGPSCRCSERTIPGSVPAAISASITSGIGCDRRLRVDPAVLRGRVVRRGWRSGRPGQGDDDARRLAGAGGGARRPDADRRRAEPARLRRGRSTAVRGILRVDRRLRAACERRLPMERREPHRGSVREGTKADLPDHSCTPWGRTCWSHPAERGPRPVRSARGELAAAVRDQLDRRGVAGTVTSTTSGS